MNKPTLLLSLAVSITASSFANAQIQSVSAERSDATNNRSSIKLNFCSTLLDTLLEGWQITG